MTEDTGIYYMPPMKKGWRLTRIGYVCDKLTKPIDEDSIALICSNKGKIVERPDDVTGKMVSEDHAMQGISKGNIAIHGMDTWHGAIAYSELDGKITRVVHVCDSSEENRYIVYYLQLLAYLGVYKLISNGVRGNTSDFRSWEKVKDIRISLPSIEEQRAIADYLDQKTAEIDKAIKDAQELIDSYKTYKQSVIYEAVTKGLNPNVTMKDSDVDWVGAAPENWKFQRGKYLFRQRNNRGNKIELQLLSPTQKFGCIPQSLYEELTGANTVKLNDKTDLNLLKTIHEGDFCISLRSFQGGFEYSNYEGVVSPAYQVFYPIRDDVYRGYYKYIFKDGAFIDKMNSFTLSLRDGKNIAFDDFGNTLLPVPPVEEQQAISDYLDNKCGQIDGIISQKENLITQLQEYKKSIIFEYVTGKKEVPNG